MENLDLLDRIIDKMLEIDNKPKKIFKNNFNLFDEAIGSMLEEDYRRAIGYFESIIEYSSDSLRKEISIYSNNNIFAYLAYCYLKVSDKNDYVLYKTKNIQEQKEQCIINAIKAIDKAVELEPNNSNYRSLRIMINSKLGKVDKEVTYDDFTNALYNFLDGNFELASNGLKSFIEKEGSDEISLIILGYANLKLGNIDDANDYFYKLQNYNPLQDYNMIIGTAYHENGYDEQAITFFEKTKNIEAARYLGGIYLSQNKLPYALKYYNKYLLSEGKEKNNINLLCIVAGMNYKLGNYQESLDNIDKINIACEKNDKCNRYLSYAWDLKSQISYYVEKKCEKALKEVLKAIAYEPTISRYIGLAQCYFDLGKYKDGVEAIDKAIDINDDASDLKFFYYLKATGCYFIGENNTAIEFVDKAVELDPDNFDYRSLRIMINNKLDRIDEAVTDLNYLCENHADNPLICDFLNNKEQSI